MKFNLATTMVLEELREKTKPYHQKIEKNILLAKLLGNVTVEDYVNILKKFYGFYFPLERMIIPNCLKDHAGLEIFYFPKLDLLEKDLSIFLRTPSEIKNCHSFPHIKSYFGWLGLLYTLEGSCLGRAMLWPRLQKKLDLKEGGSFFSSASTDLKGRWEAFCRQMVAEVDNESNKNELINGSISTFISLDEWFSAVGSN